MKTFIHARHEDFDNFANLELDGFEWIATQPPSNFRKGGDASIIEHSSYHFSNPVFDSALYNSAPCSESDAELDKNR